MARWIWLVLLVGCVQDGLVVCADGRACPVGTVCDDAHQGCVAPEQVAACVGAAEQAACLDAGACFDGVCLPAGCGNGFVEAGELCDDGNVVSGDGCSLDCTSREVCGDGATDPGRDERCDDGGTRGFDGCSSACRLEELTWLGQFGAPAPRMQAYAAYDVHRRRLVAFGGGDLLAPLDDTWEWNGQTWSQLTPLVSPPPRSGHALAYDPERRRVVLFGGTTGLAGARNDTWEWDGLVWERRPAAVSPRSRFGHAMAWDPVRHAIVLFGGSDGFSGTLGDTWLWDGVAWTPLPTTTPPPPRASVALVTDPANGRLILHGGGRDDTWVLDGQGWAPLVVGPMFASMVMAFDPIRGVVVANGLIGGIPQTWELTGAVWQQRLVTTPHRTAAAAAFDLDRQQVILFGGTDENNTGVGSIVVWNGATWATVTGRPEPLVREGSALAYDPVRGRVVMFGGVHEVLFGDPNYRGDTVEWDGRAWTSISPTSTSPAAREGHVMAYDATSGEIVLFGGSDDSSFFGDTWLWNGSAWREATVTPSPGARTGAAAVHDPRHGRVLLFGGRAATGEVLGDLWAWDGTAWTELPQVNAPPGRWSAALAYDPGRDRLVVFGGLQGLSSTTPSNDTWEWDGTTWTERATATRPASRHGAALVFDPARRRAVLFGGANVDFSAWEWDGEAWTQPTTALQPTGRGRLAATYDAANAEIITVGGRVFIMDTGETWRARFRSGADEVCLAGIDRDGDGARGCDDEDCAGRCAPQCVRDLTCDPTLPRCGDGACGVLENERMCPADCAAPAVCGDGFCAAGEACPADCY